MLKDDTTYIKDLKEKVSDFVKKREWGCFHNPKDLAESICIEAAELLQLFQWMNPNEVTTFRNDPSKIEQLEHELADIMIYCLSMTNILNIDLTKCVLNKLRINREKYPAKLYKGKARL